MDILYYYSIIFIFGLVIGSFLNSVIYRLFLPNFSFFTSLVKTKRSFCPHCNHNLVWRDLFPIFSYFVLKGKCRYCLKPISIQYPLVEISTALVFLLIFNNLYPVSDWKDFFRLCFMLYISGSMIVIFVFDLKHYSIPDKILFPAVIATFFYQLFFNYEFLVFNSLWAVLFSFLFFWAIFFVSKGRWMGFGDCKLAILLGLLLGFPNILLALFLAFFFGAIISLGAILVNLSLRAILPEINLKKLGLKSQIPFAPFLITGAFVAMIFDQIIIRWYLSLFVF